MTPDFSGWATKNDIVCTDGLVLKTDAFKHNDGQKIPLVWQHNYDTPDNVIGHGILENRPEGVYVHGFFNDSSDAGKVKELVRHGDINSLSIAAGKLVKRGTDVIHGIIREVSLVIAGANSGAVIEHVNLKHGDFITELDDEAIIKMNVTLEHSVKDDEGDEMSKQQEDQNGTIEHAEGETVQDVIDTMSDKQQALVYALMGQVSEEAEENDSDSDDADDSDEEIKQSADDNEDDSSEDKNESEAEHSQDESASLKHNQEGADMANVFEKTKTVEEEVTLSHEDVVTIFAEAKKRGSLKETFESLAHAGTYGINDIDVLFPDAKNVTSAPDVIGRRTEWVAEILGKTKHSPFARIKSTAVDLTAEEARAKGYVKGNLKKEEVIKLLKRVTTPTTVYKKQKLDRDDIVDITELDVVAWLKAEMRVMLDEEVARAILIGDGREIDDPDKIDEDHLRPIAYDNDMYAHQVNLPSNVSGDALVESILRARKHYKGTGTPALYTTDDILTDLILLKDKIGRRQYNTEAELAAALRVSKIVVVEVMESAPDILGIMVNIADYTIGADKGGKIAMFDDFDIDYNQEKYLIETRISGALTKPKSAVVIKRTSGTTVTPSVPTFDEATNTITIPTQTGVAYYDVTSVTGDGVLVSGDVVITETTDIEARPTSGYNFPHNTDADWTFAFVA